MEEQKKLRGDVGPQKRPANDENAALRGAATVSASRLQPFRKARPAETALESLFTLTLFPW